MPSLLLLGVMIALTGCASGANTAANSPPTHEEAGIMIRPATAGDVPRMVELSAMKRAQYESYSPTFWHPARDANQKQEAFFRGLVADPSWICLVNETGGSVDGFIAARVVWAPPVYDPGGKVCMIDDFVVAHPSLWPTVGMALRDQAESKASQAGAVISVTVCGQRDAPKRTALQNSDSHVASEWYVHPIAR